MSRHVRRAIYTIMALAITGAVLYVLWERGTFLPRWIVWEEGNISDASGDYEISLAGGNVSVAYRESKVWDSPENVKVQQILSCDMDYDGREELILLCWKRGRFGKYKPFWIEEDEKNWSQHIFVYEMEHDKVTPKWMSSYMGQDAAEIAFDERLFLTDPDGEISCWRWKSWGFEREEAEVSFVVFGDNIIHEPIYTYGLNHQQEFDFLYENVRDVILKNDIAVINQETPLVDDPKEYGGYPAFGTPIQVGEAIVDAEFDVVTCATNHALDRGSKGIHTTKEFFTGHDVLCLGIQTSEEERKPFEVIMRNDMKFALLNYTYGINGISPPEEHPHMVHLLGDEAQIREDIRRAKEEADAVVVFVHWGTENAEEPDAFQEKWTDVFLDCRVDVVVGTHPHVLQPYEVLEGKEGHRMLVYYSIGNFVSAQPEKSCVKGGMAHFTIASVPGGAKVTEYGLSPLVIHWQKGGKYAPVLGEE